jgi:putative transposase
MPRAARLVVPGIPLHVVQRGLNRQPCFFGPIDYIAYLDFLRGSAARFGCQVHAYCLMTNHVHLLVTPDTHDACGRLMKQVGQCHVQRINHRLGRTGTLWEGRFYSSLVNTESYVLACYRYVELNPVRAGMVTTPNEYRWSSYRTNAGIGADDSLVPHPVYLALHSDSGARTALYRELCREGIAESVAEEIRKATRLGCAIGTRRRKRGRPFKAK